MGMSPPPLLNRRLAIFRFLSRLQKDEPYG